MDTTFVLSGLCRTLEKFVEFYEWIVSLRVILYWFPNFNPYTFPFSIINYTASPFLKLFNNILPAMFGMDLSLYLGFITLEALKQLLEKCQLIL